MRRLVLPMVLFNNLEKPHSTRPSNHDVYNITWEFFFYLSLLPFLFTAITATIIAQINVHQNPRGWGLATLKPRLKQPMVKPAKSDIGCNESLKIHEWLWSILYKKTIYLLCIFKKMFIVIKYFSYIWSQNMEEELIII